MNVLYRLFNGLLAIFAFGLSGLCVCELWFRHMDPLGCIAMGALIAALALVAFDKARVALGME